MHAQSLYDLPDLYDRLMPPSSCRAFYQSVAPPEAAVLDLGCGTGRLSVPLALAGRRVTGLDAAPAMLEAAQAKAEAAGVHVEWRRGDMTSFELDRRFDLIMVTGNTLAHLTTDADLYGCLRGIRRHLGPGGLFAWDVVNAKRRPSPDPEKERTRRAPVGSGLRIRETACFNPATGVSRSQWRVQQGDGAVHRLEFALRSFRPDDLAAALESAGLRLLERYGEFDRSRYLPGSSRLQVGLAVAA